MRLTDAIDDDALSERPPYTYRQRRTDEHNTHACEVTHGVSTVVRTDYRTTAGSSRDESRVIRESEPVAV